MTTWQAVLGIMLGFTVGCSKSESPAKTPQPKPLAEPPQLTPVLIQGVRLFDGERLIEKTDVMFSFGKIVAIGETAKAPAGAEIISGEGRTLLPGLIDAHCHTWLATQLKQAAVFGVTTELDMLSIPAVVAKLKQGVRSGEIRDVADLRSAGNAFTVPGGHGTEYGFAVATLTEPTKAQAFIHARILEGSDYIKFMYDSGEAWGQKRPSVSLPLLIAGVRAAHVEHRLALVHAGTAQETLDAIGAGADGIQHVWTGLTPSILVKRIVQRHAFVVPTLSVLSAMANEYPGDELVADPQLSPYLTQSAKSRLQSGFATYEEVETRVLAETVASLYQAGVPLLVGTDAGNAGVEHGVSMHGELRKLTLAGVKELDALKGATSLAAATFGLTDRGRIMEGMRADLVLVNGDPTSDILATRDIVAVFRGGNKIDRESYRARVAATEVERLPKAPTKLIGSFEGQPGSGITEVGWMHSTDAYQGGLSTAKVQLLRGGAQGTTTALQVAGQVLASKVSFPWSGVFYYAGNYPMQVANLSGFERLSFWAKGDGAKYQVMFFLASEAVPQIQTFVASNDWAEHTFEFRRFGTVGNDIKGIFIGAGIPGPYQFELDEVRME